MVFFSLRILGELTGIYEFFTSPPVDADLNTSTIDAVTDGVNCANP